jgi:hypothetical protein
MKKAFFILLLTLAVSEAQAQLKIGLNAAVPVGDASDYYSFAAGADVYYMFGKSKDALLKFGGTAGFINYFGDEIDGLGEVDDAQFIPVAIVGRITFLSTLLFGADLGYGIGINDGNDGGAYGRVVFGLDLGNTIELNAFYHLVKVQNGVDFGATGLAILIVF